MGADTVGLVGAGGIAGVHLAAWLRLGVDVAVFSLGGAPELVAGHGGRVVSSVEELWAVSDAVDVCTPTPSHRELVLAAAAHGKYVVCEKPLALTVDDVTAMIDGCAAAGVALYPGHVVRYFPAYAAMHEAVAAGTLGALAVQRFQRVGTAPAMPWFHDDRLSGGIAMDQMIHDLDFARWNAGEVVKVYATRAVGDASGPGPALPVTAQAVLTHASGAISYVNGVWGRVGVSFQTRFEVVGDQGLLQHDSDDHQPLLVHGPSPVAGSGYRPTVPYGEDPYLSELRDFYRAFREGVRPRVSAHDGRAAVAIAVAANESIRSGRAVEPEVWP
ncbi:Gfo/Idh/MocA family protein [uncultured Friedmanniella sp.]|uniref:Gfo/Idh/MocA family protein n=1 Tax=uncultured Friedmanniella sp. TaxID=335381 RepID=UPI0035CA5A1A